MQHLIGSTLEDEDKREEPQEDGESAHARTRVEVDTLRVDPDTILKVALKAKRTVAAGPNQLSGWNDRVAFEQMQGRDLAVYAAELLILLSSCVLHPIVGSLLAIGLLIALYNDAGRLRSSTRCAGFCPVRTSLLE